MVLPKFPTVFLACWALSPLAVFAAENSPRPAAFERAPIFYSRTAAKDPVARLAKRIEAGEVVLTGSEQEVLRAVLRELQIPVESQMAVYSKTSLQVELITPATPRAIYFSDSVYVAWVPHGMIEVAAIDPELGPVFYTLDPNPARPRRLARETSCLKCHGEAEGDDMPRIFARSAVPSKTGEVLLHNDNDAVEDYTSFDIRWGGWYVTGFNGRTPHWGNAFAERINGQIDFSPVNDHPKDLTSYLDTKPYLTNTSDVVALTVFEHQITMHNSITRAAQRYRRAVQAAADRGALATGIGGEAAGEGEVETVLAASAEDIVDHLLFRAAARVPAGLDGVEAFRTAFAAGVPRSQKGESLKDFSLRGRLFANRCSFLIYSDSFAALPAPLKECVLTRVQVALQGKDPRYNYLEATERARILEILAETHPDARRLFGKSADR